MRDQKTIAEEIYKFLLKEQNGWSREQIRALSSSDIDGDPIYQGILRILRG